MFSGSDLFGAVLILASAVSGGSAPALRVCADPRNLPFSNEQGQGFENRLAALIADDLGMRTTYYWMPQREHFFGKTLNSGACDVVMGVPTGLTEAETTEPYYRSSYVFVTRRDDSLQIRSFDDPRLKNLRIGVHVLAGGNDNMPPIYALASRGISTNVVSYSIFGGDIAESNPTTDLLKALSNGNIDVAIAWGPTAGYFARHSSEPLQITEIEKDSENPNLPFAFDIGIGVRKGDDELKQKLDGELVRRRAEIVNLLKAYGIPIASDRRINRSMVEN